MVKDLRAAIWRDKISLIDNYIHGSWLPQTESGMQQIRFDSIFMAF